MEKEEFLLQFEKNLFNMFGKDLQTSTEKRKIYIFFENNNERIGRRLEENF